MRERNWPCNTNQSEAIAQRGTNNFVKNIPQQTQFEASINRRIRDRTQIDCTIHPVESDRSSRPSGQSDQHRQREAETDESNIVRHTAESSGEWLCIQRTSISCVHGGVGKNNIHDWTESGECDLFRFAFLLQLNPCEEVTLGHITLRENYHYADLLSVREALGFSWFQKCTTVTSDFWSSRTYNHPSDSQKLLVKLHNLHYMSIHPSIFCSELLHPKYSLFS